MRFPAIAVWILAAPLAYAAAPPAFPPSSPTPSVPATAAPVEPTAAITPLAPAAVDPMLPPVASAPAAATVAATPPASTAPDVAPVETSTAKPTAKTSLGAAPISIFLSPAKLQALEEALYEYESHPGAAAKVDPALEAVFESKPKVEEPETYPVFYLSSIAYRAADDWTIWVSGHKITSRKNTTDITVISVSPTQASFMWKPTYSEALTTRKRDNKFAPLDAVKNKLTRPSSYNYDEQTGVTTFTLRPNQSFVTAYMNTFEGYIESPKLTPLSTEADAAAKTKATPAAQTTSPPTIGGVPEQRTLMEKVSTPGLSAAREQLNRQPRK